MTYAGPDAGIIKQWESKVSRWVAQGRNRQEILYDMTAANWPFADAEQLVRKTASREKRKWIIVVAACGLLTMLALAVTCISLLNPRGGVFYLPISFGAAFIYGLVRLVKIKA